MRLLHRLRARRACLHHEHITGITWITSTWTRAAFSRERIGRKYRCTHCGTTWKGN